MATTPQEGSPKEVALDALGPSFAEPTDVLEKKNKAGLSWKKKGDEGEDHDAHEDSNAAAECTSSTAPPPPPPLPGSAAIAAASASSVASFASLEDADAEETIRIRGGGTSSANAAGGGRGARAAHAAASSSSSSATRMPPVSRRSVFDMFNDVPPQPQPQPHPPAQSTESSSTMPPESDSGVGSALSSVPTDTAQPHQPPPQSRTVVLLDGMHRVRAHSSTSKGNLFASSDCNNSIGAAYCDPLPPRSQSHVPHHHEPSMNDLSFLMREQDADLLESIQRKAANDEDDARTSGGKTALVNDSGVVEAAGTGASGEASESADADGSALSTIPPSLLEALPKKPIRAVSSEAAGLTAGPTSTSTTSAAPSTTTPKSARHRTSSGTIKPASLRTLLVRHESGDGGGIGSTALLRRSSQASVTGGGFEGADDHASVGTEGTHAMGGGSVGGERARMALSGEIWVLPDDVPSASLSSAGAPGAAPLPASAALISAPLSSPKRTDLPSLSVSAIDEGDETLLMPSFGADSTTNVDANSQASVAAEPKRGRMVRSESHDRRLNEAAQFAEAVGELQLAEHDELMIIEEDRNDGGEYDFDDDTDDDATEIHVEGGEPGADRASRGRSGGSASNGSAAGVLQGVPVEVSVLHQPNNKVRPQWPFRTKRTKGGFLDKLPENGTSSSQSFVYKGIRANPPEIVSRGVTRGNYSCLHRKAWLECTDKYHRYGKNLRLYYRYWERLGFPTNMFFDWLDSKGEAAGQPLPELDECPRSQLDSDTVLYITDEQETRGYAVRFVVDELGRAIVVDVDNEVVRTGPEGWIFVLRDNVMYGAQKITSVKGHCKQRFHHSSFFGGKAVAAAGIFLTDDNGGLLQVLPHSGHYRPGEAHMQRMLFFLHNQGVDLWSFQVDMQQILRVARDTDGTEKVEKKKKTETLRLTPAGLVACYLAHKARFIGEGIFSQIHRIKKADVATVSEALELIDDGSTGRTSVKEADMSH